MKTVFVDTFWDDVKDDEPIYTKKQVNTKKEKLASSSVPKKTNMNIEQYIKEENKKLNEKCIQEQYEKDLKLYEEILDIKKRQNMYKKKSSKFPLYPKFRKKKQLSYFEQNQNKINSEYVFHPKINENTQKIMAKKNQTFDERNKSWVNHHKNHLNYLIKLHSKNKCSEYDECVFIPNCTPNVNYRNTFNDNYSILNNNLVNQYVDRMNKVRNLKRSRSTDNTITTSNYTNDYYNKTKSSYINISQKEMNILKTDIRNDLLNMSNFNTNNEEEYM